MTVVCFCLPVNTRCMKLQMWGKKKLTATIFQNMATGTSITVKENIFSWSSFKTLFVYKEEKLVEDLWNLAFIIMKNLSSVSYL